MTVHVALLRGINLGKRRVKMDALRDIFVDLGFADVSTFIASGNVVFSARAGSEAKLVERIERGLAAALGYDVAAVVRTAEALAEVAAFEPDDRAPGSEPGLHVIFLDETADPAMRARLADLGTESDRFTAEGREVYWSIAGRTTDSTITPTALAKAIGTERQTARNVNTVRRLVAKLGT